jgi:prevent-host-death family protein
MTFDLARRFVAILGLLKMATGGVVVRVGIRDLRDSLSRHLDEVRKGRTVTITEHGRVIARIVPVDHPSTLERLIAEGLVRAAERPKRPSPEPIASAGTVSDLVAEQRR